MTYEEAKNQIAKNRGFKSFMDYLRDGVTGDIVFLLEEAAKLYAESKCKEQRKICAGIYREETDKRAGYYFETANYLIEVAPPPNFD